MSVGRTVDHFLGVACQAMLREKFFMLGQVHCQQGRQSKEWFLGAVTDGSSRNLAIPLDFLEAGKRYTAQVHRDGEGAHWEANPYAIAIEVIEVAGGDTLNLWLAPSGGAAVRFVPKG